MGLVTDINWKKLTQEFRGDAQSLGFCLDQSQLTMVHIRKYLRGLDLAHLISWKIPANGLTELESKVTEAISEQGLQSLPVALTLDQSQSFIKTIKLPRAAVENLDQVISYELDRFIPVAPEQVYYSFQIDHKTDVEVCLILYAVRKKPVEDCLKLLNAAGLKPISVELAPVSSANAFALLGGRRLPTSWLLLDIGESTAGLYQVNKGKLRPCLHRSYRSRDDLWPELWHAIDNLDAAGASAKTLCLTGEAISPELLEPLYQAERFSLLYDKDLLAERFSPDLPLTAAAWPALGAALPGVGKVPLTCNLLPAEDRYVIPLSNIRLIRILLATLAILSFIWVSSIYFHERVALYRIDRKIDSLAGAVEQVKQQKAEAQAIGRQLQDLYGGKGPASSKLQILALLSQTIPDHTWLYSLRLSAKQLEISGLSKSAADLIQLLDKTGLFAKTQFSSPIVNDASGNENFTIQAELKELD
jgi:Tfp pilus assembly protein PilN